MTQYNSLNVKLSNSQVNELEPAIKKKIEAIKSLTDKSLNQIIC